MLESSLICSDATDKPFAGVLQRAIGTQAACARTFVARKARKQRFVGAMNRAPTMHQGRASIETPQPFGPWSSCHGAFRRVMRVVRRSTRSRL